MTARRWLAAALVLLAVSAGGVLAAHLWSQNGYIRDELRTAQMLAAMDVPRAWDTTQRDLASDAPASDFLTAAAKVGASHNLHVLGFTSGPTSAPRGMVAHAWSLDMATPAGAAGCPADVGSFVHDLQASVHAARVTAVTSTTATCVVHVTVYSAP